MKNPAKDLVLYFGKLYSEKIGERYPPTWGRDTKMFKNLLIEYSQEKLEDLLDMYFCQKRAIYSVPMFKSELGNLIQFLQDYIASESKPIQDNESWRFE